MDMVCTRLSELGEFGDICQILFRDTGYFLSILGIWCQHGFLNLGEFGYICQILFRDT